MNGTTLSKAFVPLPGGGTAVYVLSGISYYRHSDWLGSSRLASTPSRGLYSSTAYAPFGEPYAAAGTADASFTGQNSDTVSSLYDFTFRKESSSQGRWISPDPSGLAAVDLTNPQSFNRYTYALNKPLTYTDPSGLNVVSCFLFGIGCDDGGGGGGSEGNGVGGSDPCQGNYDTCVSVNGGDPNSCDFSDPFCQWTYGSGSGVSVGVSPEPGGGKGPNGITKTFKCASAAAAETSIAGGLQHFGIGTGGASGFVTNALGGNAFSGVTDLVTSIFSGEGGGHSVFYNMGQSVVAGPTQGFGSAANIVGRNLEGTPWGSGPADIATGAIAAGGFSAVTGAGATVQTINGATSIGTATFEQAASFATGVGEVKLAYDLGSWLASVGECATGMIH